MSLWNWLLNPTGLTAHGFCLSWSPGLIAVHAASDAIIGLAYFSIPLAIAVVLRNRRDLEFRWVAYLFVAFILACGTTHLMSILTLWVPAYGVEGIIKLITAGLSIATAVLLWPLIPKILALPSQEQLRALNSELSSRIADQEHTAKLLRDSEARVRQANGELEQRVAERTAELEASNAELKAALDQRDLLLREVYHRVKNNLQVVDSLVVLQSRQLTDPAAVAALDELRNRIYALGLVHQQLMESSDLRTFDIAPFLRELSNNIVRGGSNGGVELEVKAETLVVGLDFAIPLGMLVTELLTNSLKHAFPDQKGAVKVELGWVDQSEVVLVVSDNGLTTPAESAADQASAGLGQRIIAGLVTQLQATMTVIRDGGLRTVVRIARPEAA